MPGPSVPGAPPVEVEMNETFGVKGHDDKVLRYTFERLVKTDTFSQNSTGEVQLDRATGRITELTVNERMEVSPPPGAA